MNLHNTSFLSIQHKRMFLLTCAFQNHSNRQRQNQVKALKLAHSTSKTCIDFLNLELSDLVALIWLDCTSHSRLRHCFLASRQKVQRRECKRQTKKWSISITLQHYPKTNTTTDDPLETSKKLHTKSRPLSNHTQSNHLHLFQLNLLQCALPRKPCHFHLNRALNVARHQKDSKICRRKNENFLSKSSTLTSCTNSSILFHPFWYSQQQKPNSNAH